MGSLFTSSSDLRLLFRDGGKALVKLILLAGIVVLISVGIVKMAPPANDYFGALKMKHERLESLQSPKIIVIGGSNGAFGIDSKMLEDSLGLPVVNMAIHADLSYQFMANEIMRHIGEGDLVIAIPEYPVAINAKSRLNSAVLGALAAYPEAQQYFPNLGEEASRKMLAFVVRQAFYRIFYNEVPKVYRSDGFNEYGDLISHLEIESAGFDYDTAQFKKISLEEFDAVHGSLSRAVAVEKAHLFLSLPSIMESKYGRDISYRVNAEMKKKGIPVISAPKDYLFPREYFFDSNYHLNKKGREERTKRLIKDVKKQLKEIEAFKSSGVQ